MNQQKPKDKPCYHFVQFFAITICVLFLWQMIHVAHIYNEMQEMSYFCIFECGSQHTSLFVFRWNAMDQKMDQIGQAVHAFPGIGNIKLIGESVREYLSPLFIAAENYIDNDRHKIRSANFFLRATSGIRMMDFTKGQLLMQDALEFLQEQCSKRKKFRVKNEWVGTIDGREEGLFGWISANYILGSLTENVTINKQQINNYQSSPEDNVDSYGFIDFGGGSLQIAFELPYSFIHQSAMITPADIVHVEVETMQQKLESLEKSYGKEDDQIERDKQMKYVYVRSFEGWGRERMFDVLQEEMVYEIVNKIRNDDDAFDGGIARIEDNKIVAVVDHPCIPVGVDNVILYEIQEQQQEQLDNINISEIKFVGSGDFDQCRQLIKKHDLLLLNQTNQQRNKNKQNNNIEQINSNSILNQINNQRTNSHNNHLTQSAHLIQHQTNTDDLILNINSFQSFGGSYLPYIPEAMNLVGISNFGFLFNTLMATSPDIIQLHDQDDSDQKNDYKQNHQPFLFPFAEQFKQTQQQQQLSAEQIRKSLQFSQSTFNQFESASKKLCSLTAQQLSQIVPDELKEHREGKCFTAAIITEILVEGLQIGQTHWEIEDDDNQEKIEQSQSNFKSQHISPIQNTNQQFTSQLTQSNQPSSSSSSSSSSTSPSIYMVSQIGKENDAGWALGAALCEAQMIRHSLTHQQKRKSLQSQNQIENQGQDIDDEEDEERRRIESKYELTYDQIRQSKISFNFTLHPIFPQNTTTDFDTSEEPDEKLKDSKSWIGDYFADPPVPIQLEVEQGTYFVLNRGSEWNEMREIYIRGCLILLIMFITLQLVSFYTSQNPPRNYKDQNM